jgi:16S rRNA (cytidine1402-2'-O)-methyltransferase
MRQMSTLYMIPVPISEGSLDTLPARTVDTTRRLTHFLAENAKSARHFLKEIGHPVAIQELEIIEIGHRISPEKIKSCLQRLEEGTDVGILSEAGCPGIADPGASLALQAQKSGFHVVPLVGPCSPVLALMASGLDGQNFRFCGYLPIKEDERRKALLKLEQRSSAEYGETQLFIETPYRNQNLLGDLLKHLSPSTYVLVATDICGSAEFICTKNVADWRRDLPQLPKLPTVFGLLAQTKKSASSYR